MRQILIAALVAGAASAVLAQETAAPEKPKAAEAKAGATLARIAVIDMGLISSETLLGKGYAAELQKLKAEIDSEGTKKQNELQKLEAAIVTLQDDLKKQANVLSPEARDKKEQEITKKTRERQAFLEDGQQELARMRDRAQQQAQAYNNEFQQKIRPTIEAAARDKGVDVLIYDGALTINKAYDISQEVIVRADDAERAARAKAAAAKPAEKPAPAAPKPAPAPTPVPSPKP